MMLTKCNDVHILKVVLKVIVLMTFTFSCFAVNQPNRNYVCGHGYCMRLENANQCKNNFALLEKNAAKGNEKALSIVTTCYLSGIGTPVNHKEAEGWLRFWASKNAAGQFNLALYLQRSEGIQPALKWYKKAAENGFISAQTNLGVIYLIGNKQVPKNVSKGLYWLKKAAPHDLLAQFLLATWYFRNKNTQAVSWMYKAAMHNHPRAQTYMGDMYAMGFGVEKNDKKAVYWYQRGFKNGDPMAAYVLGLNYANGEMGAQKDTAKAIHFFKIAAEQGYVPAQYNLVLAYGLAEGGQRQGLRMKNYLHRVNEMIKRHRIFPHHTFYRLSWFSFCFL